ncbi:MAG: hypothetical protein IK954_00610 [Clostridia bacterium]|nr:hypothetical protein [Clostridia bacterium]
MFGSLLTFVAAHHFFLFDLADRQQDSPKDQADTARPKDPRGVLIRYLHRHVRPKQTHKATSADEEAENLQNDDRGR